MMTDTPPGLQGNYRGSCVVCLRGTDSGAAFRGAPEFVIAMMVILGIPQDEATGSLSLATGNPPGMAPAHDLDYGVNICEECAARLGMRVGLLGSPSMPVYLQPAS